MIKTKTTPQKIDEIFNILIQYEKINEADSGVSIESYQGYLDRLYVWYVGEGNDTIYNYLRGLYMLGNKASHETVRRIVFDIIGTLENGKLKS